jgi:protein-S-isoprenylcysteine O-methyltransferase Ste14
MLPARLERFRNTKTYDTLMALPLIAWFGSGGWNDAQNVAVHVRLIRAGAETTVGVLQMIAVTVSALFCAMLIVVLLVRSVPRARADGIWPRLFAVAGTFVGTGFLQLSPVALPLWLQATAVVLIIVASVLGVLVVSWLGRSFSIIPEARVLVTTGPYALVRHPLYGVEVLAITAMLIQFFSAWAVALFLSFVSLQVIRSLYEERVLEQAFPEYRDYQKRTARFLPHLF